MWPYTLIEFVSGIYIYIYIYMNPNIIAHGKTMNAVSWGGIPFETEKPPSAPENHPATFKVFGGDRTENPNPKNKFC